MVIDRRKGVVLLGAAVLRIALFVLVPSLPELLTGRVEVSTPVTSFKRCECFMRMSIVEDVTLIPVASAGRSLPLQA